MISSTPVLSRRRFAQFALTALSASALFKIPSVSALTGGSTKTPLALSVALSGESTVLSYRSLVAQHANRVLPTSL